MDLGRGVLLGLIATAAAACAADTTTGTEPPADEAGDADLVVEGADDKADDLNGVGFRIRWNGRVGYSDEPDRTLWRDSTRVVSIADGVIELEATSYPYFEGPHGIGGIRLPRSTWVPRADASSEEIIAEAVDAAVFGRVLGEGDGDLELREVGVVAYVKIDGSDRHILRCESAVRTQNYWQSLSIDYDSGVVRAGDEDDGRVYSFEECGLPSDARLDFVIYALPIRWRQLVPGELYAFEMLVDQR